MQAVPRDRTGWLVELEGEAMRFGHGTGRDEGPRRHHHEFTHVVLRAIAFQLGTRIFPLARDGQLAAGLRGAWERAGADLPEEDRLPSSGLSAVHVERGSMEAALVLLPQPLRAKEAYLACAVRAADPFLGPGDPEYFVLEDDRTIRGRQVLHRTRLSRWTRDGRRLDLGEGPLPEAGALLDTISRVMTIGS